jgi:hypothetical protein
MATKLFKMATKLFKMAAKTLKMSDKASKMGENTSFQAFLVLMSYSWCKTIKIVHNLKKIEGRLYKFKMAAITSATWPTSGRRSGILITQLCRASLKSCI